MKKLLTILLLFISSFAFGQLKYPANYTLGNYCFVGDGANNYFNTGVVAGDFNTIIFDFYIRDNIPSGHNQILLLWNGTRYDCYLNGVSVTVYDIAGHTGGIRFSNNPVYVCKREATATYFTGKIIAVEIYSQIFTGGELTAYFANTTRPYTPLISLQAMSGHGADVWDVSGNSKHATITGSNCWDNCTNSTYSETNGMTYVKYNGQKVLVPYLLSGTELYTSVSPVMNASETTNEFPYTWWDSEKILKANNKILKQ